MDTISALMKQMEVEQQKISRDFESKLDEANLSLKDTQKQLEQCRQEKEEQAQLIVELMTENKQLKDSQKRLRQVQELFVHLQQEALRTMEEVQEPSIAAIAPDLPTVLNRVTEPEFERGT